MHSESIIRINDIISTFNHNQQVIARNLMSDTKFQISEMYVYGFNQFVIRDLTTTEVFIFKDYVKSKCNCG